MSFWKDLTHRHDSVSCTFNSFQLSLDLYYTEDEIYELSCTKEPKNPKIQVRLTQISLSGSQLLKLHTMRAVCVALLSVGVTSSKQTVILAAE